MQKLLTFSAQILAYIPYLKIKRFNETLTNDIFSFEQLGLEVYHDVIIDAQRKKLALMSYASKEGQVALRFMQSDQAAVGHWQNH